MKKYDVVIIGAGTAGLSARKEVAQKTDNYIVVDNGPLGTTCARVGCMPSKVLIQVANDFYRRNQFKTMGIQGGESLELNLPETFKHVRNLRDRFVRSVNSSLDTWKDKLVQKKATLIDKNTLDLEGEKVLANKIIIATGSRPIIPSAWEPYKSHLIDTNSFFELESLPKKIAVIGLGVIGIELGQALNRLGVEVIGITVGKKIGGISDPEIQNYIYDKISKEMKVHINGAEVLGITDQNLLKLKADDEIYEVEKALVSIGRTPNIDNIGIKNIGINLDKRGLPEVNPNTLELVHAPNIFLPGDVNAERPILHEAADEGIIAGHNSVNEPQCFKRRTFLGITFADPNIATIGKNYDQLVLENTPFVTGRVSFEGQGRSIVKLKEQGLLHLYAHKETGEILGAELQAPDGEHLAHLISWAVTLKLTVFEALKLPFYHPVIEEGLRTALRDAASKIKDAKWLQTELFRCSDAPIR